MKSNKIEQLIVAYMDGKLDQEGQKQLLELMQSEGRNIKSLTELENLSGKLDNFPEVNPSENLTISFYSQLNRMKGAHVSISQILTGLYNWFDQNRYRRWAVQIAFALLLVWSGWMFGRQDRQEIQHLNSEVVQMKEMFSLAMLKDSSPSRRIQALQYISGYDAINHRLRTAVAGVLKRDANVNVRLEALETLMRYSDDELVRTELLTAIEKQNEPMMQIAITEAMINLHEIRAIAGLHNLLKRRDLNFMVREIIETSISRLS